LKNYGLVKHIKEKFSKFTFYFKNGRLAGATPAFSKIRFSIMVITFK
jgi:hypothetical protein